MSALVVHNTHELHQLKKAWFLYRISTVSSMHYIM